MFNIFWDATKWKNVVIYGISTIGKETTWKNGIDYMLGVMAEKMMSKNLLLVAKVAEIVEDYIEWIGYKW